MKTQPFPERDQSWTYKHDSPKGRAKFAREAVGFLVFFTDLRYLVEETTSMNSGFTGLRSVTWREKGLLMEFKSPIGDIADKLAQATIVNLKRAYARRLTRKRQAPFHGKLSIQKLIGLVLQKDRF